MLSIEGLMMMTMEEVDAEEKRYTDMWEERMEQKCDMEKYYDLREVDNWLVYEEIMQDIDYIEENLETIKDYRDNYDYYWDMI